MVHTTRFCLAGCGLRRWLRSADELISSVLPQHLQAASVELAPYLVDSIGNSTRIDYGTGHETTFCALLCCLAKLGVLTKDDLQVPIPCRPCSLTCTSPESLISDKGRSHNSVI